jgi:LmbE family N-acetylglucosaminyl deacetylase
MVAKHPWIEMLPAEVPVFENIDGSRSVSELESLHPGSRELILKWHTAHVLELLPPKAASPVRPHIVVVEPHPDDAVLSVGGMLLHRRNLCRLTIVSIVEHSNYTSFLESGRRLIDCGHVRGIRTSESRLATAVLGARHVSLGWSDAPIRFWPRELWDLKTMERFNRDRTPFTRRFPDLSDITTIAERLLEVLVELEPDEIWIPMGLGNHVDHRTTRSACLQILANSKEYANTKVLMYEEVPYGIGTRDADRLIDALEKNGASMVRQTEDISDVFEQKMRLISIYASQFKASAIRPRVQRQAEEAGAGSLAETYHVLDAPRSRPRESELDENSAALRNVSDIARETFAERRDCTRLTIMAFPTAMLGMWRDNLQLLLSTFANAKLIVYLSDEAMWQAVAGWEPRIELHVVRGRMTGWIYSLLCELPHLGTPTITILYDAYDRRKRSKVIRWLLPKRPIFLVRSFCAFCGILQEVAGETVPANQRASAVDALARRQVTARR